MAPGLPTVEQLVASVTAAEVAELDRVRAAVVMADHLGTVGDDLVNHFVEAARAAGCSWSQIGAQLGVSKQAAQQAFVSPMPRRGRFGRRTGEPLPRGRFRGPAAAVIVAAREEAGLLGHNYVGTEHLLLAVATGTGAGAEALGRLGVDPEAIRNHIVEIVGRGTGDAPSHRPMTPRTKKVLELAVRESIRLQRDQVGTEHVLLALVREGQGVAAQILVRKLGIDLPRVTQTVTEVVTGSGPHTPGEPRTG